MDVGVAIQSLRSDGISALAEAVAINPDCRVFGSALSTRAPVTGTDALSMAPPPYL